MKRFLRARPSPAILISGLALFAALGGTSYAMSSEMMGHGGQSHGPQTISSHGVKFIGRGESVTLGRAGNFKFYASCSNASGGAQSVTFGVVANTTADLDGNGPMPAGTKIVIHTDSDSANSTPQAMLSPGDFAQVASASSSTELANDGQEADVFYTDGVNWGGGGETPSHACFAGYTGLLAGAGHGHGSLGGSGMGMSGSAGGGTGTTQGGPRHW
jgi:hypothetical protein